MISALALTGPTASGKTALSISLARTLGCEIISCDSMQIYSEMSIGTAKPTEAERTAVPHHMVGTVSVRDCYSAEDYRGDAMQCAADITERGGIPLFVGGTGLYIDTVMRGGAQTSPPSSEETRARLLEGTDTEDGRRRLWQRLQEVDPDSAAKTHMNNVRRVCRALEIYELTGMTKTYFDRESRTVTPDISVGMITLDFHNRDNLYSRIDARVDAMMEEGLLGEVRALYEEGLLDDGTTASQAIGYKELIPYLRGDKSLDDCIDDLKQSSRRYAKRQLTWFRSKADAVRIYLDTDGGVMKPYGVLEDEIASAARELFVSL